MSVNFIDDHIGRLLNVHMHVYIYVCVYVCIFDFGKCCSLRSWTASVYPCCAHNTVSKESAFNAGDKGLILGLRRSPGEGNGNPLQYSCLENPRDGGAW